MIGLGFNFDHFTGMVSSTPDLSIYLCYDYAFYETANGRISVVHATSDTTGSLVIPENERESIITTAHDDHLGIW